MSERIAVTPKSRGIEGILYLIEANGLSGGDQLPPERELCQTLGVSRTALRAAISALTSRHVLESRPGYGTFVMPQRPIDVMQKACSYSDSVRAAGMTPGSRLVSASMHTMTGRMADLMEVAEGTQAFHLRRVRLADDRPVSIEETYVNHELCPGIARHDFGHESLYDVLRGEYGIVMEHGRERVTVGRLDAEEARLLEAHEGDPVLRRDGLEISSTGESVELVHATILPSRYRLAVVTKTR